MKRRNFFAALGAIPLAAVLKPKEAKMDFSSKADISTQNGVLRLACDDGSLYVTSSNVFVRSTTLELQSGIPLERV